MHRWEARTELDRPSRLGTLGWTVLGLLVFFAPVAAGLYFGSIR